MEGYLGEVKVSVKKSPYNDFTAKDWALYYVYSYGQIDGAHHKQWVIDQMARILMGTPMIIKLAKWDNGQKEYRFDTGKPSKKYVKWVEKYKCGGYSYDEGIAP